MTSPAKDGNPLKFDPELRDMLDKLDTITSYKKFQGWRSSFLSRFESFLVQDGIEYAKGGYKDYCKVMDNYVKSLNKVEQFVESGDLTNERVTVKGRNSLNEMCKQLESAVRETESLIPATGQDEKKRRFTKYQLGAVLIRDGFSEYDKMKYVSEALKKLGENKLSELADKQQLELFASYTSQLQRFCDVMADLGLYEGMFGTKGDYRHILSSELKCPLSRFPFNANCG